MMKNDDPVDELVAKTSGLSPITVLFVVDGEKAKIGDGEPKATLSLSRETLRKMLNNEEDATALFMKGELTIEGDIGAAAAFGQALQPADDTAAAAAPEPAGAENPNIAYLDNIGLIVQDLTGIRPKYEALGFNLAARGTHYYERPEGVFTKWGTANHCVNFRDGGLLEFIGHYYPEHPAGLYGEQLKASGDHWGKITLHVNDCDLEIARLRRQGLPAAEPSILYRYTDGDVFDPAPSRSKKTHLFSYPNSFEDGFMTVGAQHTLGAFPISEEHFNHPNGAQRMTFALIGATALEATVKRYEEALSIQSTALPTGRDIHLGRDTHLCFVSSDRLPDSLQAQMGHRHIAVLGAGFEVRDVSATQRYLEGADIPTEETPWGIGVTTPIPGGGAVFFG